MEEDGNDTSSNIHEDARYEHDENFDFCVDSSEDIARIQMVNISIDDVYKFSFCEISLAFQFYNLYARTKGFSVRRSKTRRNKNNVLVKQVFVCSCEGFRDGKYYKMQNRTREPKPETRGGCMARILVHFEGASGRWIVIHFFDEHNHELVDPKFVGMLRSQKKMSEAAIGQMNSMRSAGINTPKIFGSLAMQSGGYQNVGFGVKDMYNQYAKQRRQLPGDVGSMMLFLEKMKSIDLNMFVSHEADKEQVLRHIFWCDGASQLDYHLFGDVIAFDATYKKNKYKCPLVIFSGVNNHNQTVIFARDLVSDETEGTCVWLLENFLEAMKVKSHVSVITDGDLAMRGAMRKVFPNAHHRLCAWHLMRNATSNIGQPKFTTIFRKYMLGDYSIGEFQQKWKEMVDEFGVHDRPWILDLYEKRHMWATAYIRGKFFAGFRTSRCEGLHSQLAKYVKSQYNLIEFMQHYRWCLNRLRYNETKADYDSIKGELVIQTPLQNLERFASKVYTRAIFSMFRTMLDRASVMRVKYEKETGYCVIYGISRYCRPELLWNVSFHEEKMQLKCSCLLMESIGIPCDHIIAVLVHLDIGELPQSLILNRWTKNVKKRIHELNITSGLLTSLLQVSRKASLLEWSNQVVKLGCQNSAHFYGVTDTMITLIRWMKEDNEVNNEGNDLREP